MEDIKSTLKFHDYIVEEVSFKANLNKEENEEYEIDFGIEPHIYYNADKTQMFVNLKTSLFQNEEENYPFKMIVVLTGYFSVQMKNEDISKFEANAIAILYPYIRALVSTYTANCNVAPMILPTINVNKMLKKK